MIHMERFISKLQLSDFTALVLQHSVVLLLLTHTCGGQSQMIGTSQPIVAMVGDDIILPCHLQPAVDASDLTVEWVRPELNPKFVHLRRDSVELLLEEHPWYKGRTSLSDNKLQCGDISLTLSKVGPSDAGTYRCLVPSSNAESQVELTVGSVSSPEIAISKVSNGVLLECKSKGWYPKPEVLWLDGEGNLLPAGPTETVRGPDVLYTVSSRVTVEKRHSNNFICRVQQKNINQTRETQIHVPVDLFMVQSSPAVRIIICLAVCFMFIVSVFFIVWKGRQKQENKSETSTDSNERQRLMEAERDREQSMTESEKIKFRKVLENTKVKLDEELQKTEGELKHVQQVITTLMDQKKDLNNQRDKLILLQHEEKTRIEETMKSNNKTRIMSKDKKQQKHEKDKQDLEKKETEHENLPENTEEQLKTTGEKTKSKRMKFKKDKKREKCEKTIEDLEKKKTEHENLLENTEKLLKTTEDLIIKMTERKVKLESSKEQINKNLRETERQREESQRKLQSETQEERNDP